MRDQNFCFNKHTKTSERDDKEALSIDGTVAFVLRVLVPSARGNVSIY